MFFQGFTSAFGLANQREFELRKRGIQKYGVMRMPPKFRIETLFLCYFVSLCKLTS